MSLSTKQSKQVSSRIRKHLSSKDWAWRYSAPKDEIDIIAISRLRESRDKACLWCEIASERIGLPLPIGNGINGPWNRSAVINSQNEFGIADIASGRIAWTNTIIPNYIKRFVCKFKRVISPNIAGGSGGMGSAIGQVTLIFGMRDAIRPKIKLPKPIVNSIEYGLQTCYGCIGTVPTADEYRKEWAELVKLGVSCYETTAPQWEVTLQSIDAELAASWLKMNLGNLEENWHRKTQVIHSSLRLRPSHMVGEVDVEVLGLGDKRRQKRDSFAKEFYDWASVEAANRAAKEALKVMLGAKIKMPETSHIGCRSWYDILKYDINNVRLKRLILGAVKPKDPLTQSERKDVQKNALEILAKDSVKFGKSVTDPWGRPGYMDGCYDIWNILGRKVRHCDDIKDEPGIRDWIQSARDAAKSEMNRIRSICPEYGTCGTVSDRECAALESCGYNVERQKYGHISIKNN